MRFNSLIEALAREHPPSPLFTSHITLLGGIRGAEDELLQGLNELAGALKPFEVRLEGLAGHEDSFYRCLYLRAEPSEELLDARRQAERLFAGFRDEATGGEAFMPHLSILYGRMDHEARQKMINSLGSALGCSFESEGVSLYRTDGAPAGWARAGVQHLFK